MTLSKISGQPCKNCGNGKGKLQRIIEGWKNYIFPDPQIELKAKYRALRCASCDFNRDILDNEITGFLKPLGLMIPVCTKCWCPIEAKTRSMDAECEINRW